jgi:hypothetical protein
VLSPRARTVAYRVSRPSFWASFHALFRRPVRSSKPARGTVRIRCAVRSWRAERPSGVVVVVVVRKRRCEDAHFDDTARHDAPRALAARTETAEMDDSTSRTAIVDFLVIPNPPSHPG